ncbi:prepilin-type N-terminal cleavage/methylation domain-containing protein [Caldimonas brevitalea]|uniref:General secretion pathway protein I n=1 Tax=Caldimonas brevitalea TaxID=413882 RepID=A0A0G3BQQ6_9BURK|nr:prepilin-type N-terminal cleavage/methylation domain-containing protein [Caldimonas brevitalea]AKJ29726.1 hypothetical protein AAW51_3035 [Caldimonas brevitalea]
MTTASASRGARGFSLLEVLVALAICALMLAALLPASVAAVERLEHASEQGRSLRLARSILERHAAAARIAEGASQGRQGGLNWKVQVERLQPQSEQANLLVLRRIRVDVTPEGSASTVSLTAYRVGEPS